MDEIRNIWPDWEIEGVIGKGAYGCVYRAKREHLGHISEAAIKIITIPGDSSEIDELRLSQLDEKSITAHFEEIVQDFMNEISVMETLESANNIVGIKDYQIIRDEKDIKWKIYIRMELLSPLGKYIAENTLTVKDIVRLGIEISNALIFCENKNIIHRDIKIDNIFVNEFGTFKLGDFGIAKQLEKTNAAVSRKGTNMYMAPEVFCGARYDHSVDMYSLGIVLYRLLNNGKYPFLAPDQKLIQVTDQEMAMKKRLEGEKLPAPIDADEELSEIILRMCAYFPEERFKSAGELKNALEIYEQTAKNQLLSISRNAKDSEYSAIPENRTDGLFELRNRIFHEDIDLCDIKKEVQSIFEQKESEKSGESRSKSEGGETKEEVNQEKTVNREVVSAEETVPEKPKRHITGRRGKWILLSCAVVLTVAVLCLVWKSLRVFWREEPRAAGEIGSESISARYIDTENTTENTGVIAEDMDNYLVTYQLNGEFYISDYDDHGVEIGRTHYDEEGNLTGVSIITRSEENGEKIITVIQRDPDGNLLENARCHCDADWNYIRIDRFDESNTLINTYTYNETRNVREKYDANGTWISTVQYYPTGEVKDEEKSDKYIVAEYTGNAQTKVIYYRDKTKREILNWFECKVGKNGYRTSITRYNNKNIKTLKVVYKKSILNLSEITIVNYDAKGNALKTTKKVNGEVTEVETANSGNKNTDGKTKTEGNSESQKASSIIMPDVMDLERAAAEQKLEEMGIKYYVDGVPGDDEYIGRVVGQSPWPGEEVSNDEYACIGVGAGNIEGETEKSDDSAEASEDEQSDYNDKLPGEESELSDVGNVVEE